MPNPSTRRWLAAVLVLAGAALACARAEVPIQPVADTFSSPVPVDPTATTAALAAATNTPGASEAPPTPSATPPATATPVPTVASTLQEIPAEAQFSQAFTVSADGDFPFGLTRDLADGQTLTWASLRNGQGTWLLDLGQAQQLAGVRLTAHRDGDEDSTLLAIETSADGLGWALVYTGQGSCGDTAGCDVLAAGAPIDVPFGPVRAQYVRLRSGPSPFALAEVSVAVLP